MGSCAALVEWPLPSEFTPHHPLLHHPPYQSPWGLPNLQGLPKQNTTTSSLWLQSWYPQDLCWHCSRDCSCPLQWTSSSQMRPSPGTNFLRALAGTKIGFPQPSCWHTTCSSFVPQPSSQTEPHMPLCSTSSRPEQLVSPFTSLNLKGSAGSGDGVGHGKKKKKYNTSSTSSFKSHQHFWSSLPACFSVIIALALISNPCIPGLFP